ncbi:MAG: thioredoxin domain-containing protein [Acidobacteriota bacterium]
MHLPLLLVVFALATAGWSGFLWWQLVQARAGFETLCVGGTGCTALWDGAFAAGVHASTGLPVAAWGVVWGVVAAWVAGWLWSTEDTDTATRPLGALAWVALGGVAGVLGLVVVIASAGEFCGNCAIVYGLVLAWVVLAFGRLRGSGVWLGLGGAVPAGLAVVVLWLALLWPGLATPKEAVAESSSLVQADAQTDPHAGHDHGAGGHEGHDHSGHDHGEAPQGPSQEALVAALQIDAWPPSDEVIRERLGALAGFLDPRARGQMGDLFAQIDGTAPLDGRPTPRAPHGDGGVVVTEFTDTLCGHCAQLFMEVKLLDQLLPDEAFSVDSRQYPLDHRCNTSVEEVELDGRCEAATARICVEELAGRFEYEEMLYRNQRQLNASAVLELAAPWIARAELEACMVSPETGAKLREDTDYAARYDIRGTPLVLIDGRQVPAFLPAIYALILTGGDASHPALGALTEATS